MKKVVVIGGGVIGLCTAYYLQKEQCEVTVIDQSNMDFGASYVNAGYISPSHLIPLASPGVVRQGLKWMFNSASPLYIKPRLERDFLSWALAFNKSCSVNNVNQSIKAIKDITLLSGELFEQIKSEEQFKFHLEKKGLLVLCQSEAMLLKEEKLMNLALQEGLDVSLLNPSEVAKLEPLVRINAMGATYYESDWHSTPQEFMDELKGFLQKKGVVLIKNEKVENLHVTNNKIDSIGTQNGKYVADEFVIAAGSWSHLLAKKLGIKILLQAGKGYRINTHQPTGITIPSILAESKAAVTPMNGFTRFAGTMEIAGINHDIRKERVSAIANAAHRYYPDLVISENEKQEAACGLRPVSPDGRPYIGTSNKCVNLTIATGHAMMGWSMAPATGKLVSEIITGKPTSIEIGAFHPDRKF